MNKKRNMRLLAVLLVTCFLITSSPVAAVVQAMGEGEPGSISIDKAAVPEQPGRWTVTLTLSGVPVPTSESADIVLVVDTSNSMEGSRLTAAKAAATNFVTGLLDADNIRIALVSFGSEVETGGFQGESGKQDLLDAIEDLSADGGTFTQAGIREARSLLSESEADHKAIVLLSDGQPTYSYEIPEAEDNFNSDYFVHHSSGWGSQQWYTRDDLAETVFDYDSRVGSGGSMTTDIDYTWQLGDPVRYYDYHHGHSAIAESRFAKSDGITVYTVAFEADSGQDILDRIASSGKSYQADGDTLDDILGQVAGSIIPAATNAVITDTIGEMFDFVEFVSVSLPGTIEGSVSISEDRRVITWNLGNITETPATLSYIVEIRPEAVSGENYPTNGDTFVEYTDAWDDDGSMNFDSPEVNIVKPQDLDIVDYEGVYDGESHSIEVTSQLDEGEILWYRTGDSDWSEDNPGFVGVGEYTVNVKVTKPDHEDRTGFGTVTISARPITVTADAKTKVQGEDDPPLTYEVTGELVEGDSFTGVLERDEGEIAGTYAIKQGSLVLSDNYTLTYVGATLTILASDAELAITNYTGVYDGESHSIEVTSQPDEDETPWYSTDGGESWLGYNPSFVDVGEYTVNVKFVNSDEEERSGTGTVTINQRPLEITAGSASKTHDGNPLTKNTYSITDGSVADGDELVSVKVTGSQTSVGSSANVASEAVIKRAVMQPQSDEGEDNREDVTENYVIAYVSGTLRVTSGGGGLPPTQPPEEPIEPDLPPLLNLADHFAYIVGYPDDTVRPEGRITREEVAAVFFRLLDPDYRELVRASESLFPDVLADRWSSKHIATLAAGQIIEGYPDGTFQPGSFITRAELATIASRFDKLSSLDTNVFPDVEGHWAEEYINSAAAKGWVEGYPDGTFKPDEYITRAEFVTLVNRVLERAVHMDDILPEARQFPDLLPESWYYEAMQEAINSHLYERREDGSEEWLEINYPEIEM